MTEPARLNDYKGEWYLLTAPKQVAGISNGFSIF